MRLPLGEHQPNNTAVRPWEWQGTMRAADTDPVLALRDE